MTTAKDRSRAVAEIRRQIESWAEALRAKDLPGVMSHYVPDVLSFDLAPPLQHRGDAIGRGLAEWFPTWDGPIGYEIRDLSVTAGDDVAFCHSLNRLTGRRTSGEATDVWLRSTVCFRRIDGRWKAVHEHASVPFYMDGSYRAAVDLKP
jgi:ketosteroid isomerase-like protein